MRAVFGLPAMPEMSTKNPKPRPNFINDIKEQKQPETKNDSEKEEKLKKMFLQGRRKLQSIIDPNRYSLDEVPTCPEDPPGLKGPLVVKVDGEGDDFAPGSAEYEGWYGPV